MGVDTPSSSTMCDSPDPKGAQVKRTLGLRQKLALLVFYLYLISYSNL